jgi:hypothetical protein
MSTVSAILEVENNAQDLAQKTVCVKVRLGLLGNTRKVGASNIEVDADKELIRVTKVLIDSEELRMIGRLDGQLRRYLEDTCLPFEAGIHLLPLPVLEAVDDKLQEFERKRSDLVEAFLSAYPALCQQAAARLRTLYDPRDYPPIEFVRSRFAFTWQYVSFGVPGQLREISAKVFENEREKAARLMSEASQEIQQVLRSALAEMVEHLRERLTDDADGRPRQLRESAVQKLRAFLDTFDFRNVTDDRELKEEVEKARALLKDVNTDAIRNVDAMRAQVREGMAAIASRLDAMIIKRPSRKFRWAEDA